MVPFPAVLRPMILAEKNDKEIWCSGLEKYIFAIAGSAMHRGMLSFHEVVKIVKLVLQLAGFVTTPRSLTFLIASFTYFFRAISHCKTASRFVSSLALIP